jgi:beta-barrel assembly-enhancing protease
MDSIVRKLALALIIALIALPLAAQNRVMLPDMGSTSTRVLTAEQERTFARDFERYMRAHNLLVEDPLIRSYFKDMGFRLVAQSSRPNAEFHFFVIRDPGINAFATVAGVVGLNAGLILMAHDESEVAGVVAHEIAHITQDHLARGLENQQQVALPTMLAAMGLAIAAAAAGAGEASQAALLSGMGIAAQFQINHTRQAEAEADRVGIGLMSRSGYDPKGMTRFFERLNVYSRAMGQGPPEYLRTHPLTVNRIAEARSRAEQIPARELRESDEFHYVQSRLRVMMSDRPDNTAEWFRLRLREEERPPEAMRYGLVLSLIRGRHLDEAEQAIAPLLEANPDRQLHQMLLAELRHRQDRREESLEILARLYTHFPGNRAITTQYASTLMHDHDPKNAALAMDVLRRHLRRYPDDLQMTELLARAADRTGEKVRAAEALADSYYMRGGVREAIEQLERVTEQEDLDYYQRSRINARLAELRSEHMRMARRDR